MLSEMPIFFMMLSEVNRTYPETLTDCKFQMPMIRHVALSVVFICLFDCLFVCVCASVQMFYVYGFGGFTRFNAFSCCACIRDAACSLTDILGCLMKTCVYCSGHGHKMDCANVVS